MVETGITGNDEIGRIPRVAGHKNPLPTRTFMQIPGAGYKIKANHLIEEFERVGTLHKMIQRYFQAHLVLTGRTVSCNRLHDTAERLARWLLMCHDRRQSRYLRHRA